MASDAEKVLALIEQWTHEHGAALKPRGADTFGEGMREAKRQIAALLATAPEPEPGRCPCGGTLVLYGSSNSTAPESVVWADHLTCLFCAKTAPLPGRGGGR